MKPGSGWPIGIALILGTTVIGNLIVMRIANDDPSFAIESNYYQKAVAFDSTMSAERNSAKLGWVATTSVARDSIASLVQLKVSIANASMQPVTGLAVDAQARFNARANDILSVTLREVSPGVYVAPLRVTYAGVWEVRVNARRKEDSGVKDAFVSTERVEVSNALLVAPSAPVTPSGLPR